MIEEMPAVGVVAGMAEMRAIAAAEQAVIAAGTQVDVGGGRYAFHPAELKSVIDGWKGIIDTLSSGKTTTVTRTPHSPAVMTPGNEQASNTVSDVAHASNQAYQDYLTNALNYAQGVHDNLNKIYTNYLTTEQTQADAARGLQS